MRRTYPDGSQTVVRYERYKTITFRSVDASTGQPAEPVIVTKWDDFHRNTDVYSVDPAETIIQSSMPVGIDDSSQNSFVSWVHNHFDAVSGALVKRDVFHNIPSTGTGSLGTNFYSTEFLHTPMGHFGAATTYVDTNKYQVVATLYNIHDRPVELRRGVATTPPTDYDALDNAITSTPPSGFAGYATVTQVEYDNGGVGDGYVTRAKQYHGTGTNDYTQTVLYRTYRGDVRGVKRQYHSGTSLVDVTPYNVIDVDWMGRTITTAQYESQPNWTNDILSNDTYTFYVTGHPTGRHNRTHIYFDLLGRVYRTTQFPGTEGTKHFEHKNYYDRRDMLVATGDRHGAHAEFAYDGAARQYQSRTVLDVSEDPYDGAEFAYRAPAPHTSLGSMSNDGDDGLIEFAHTVYDAAGNATEEHTCELNHTDANGIDMDSSTSYVRATTYYWYDGADRLLASAYYGSGDTTSGAGSWKYVATVPTRAGSAPTYSDTDITNGRALLTKYEYHYGDDPNTSSTENSYNTSMTDPSGIKTKTYYDDHGRRSAVAENYVDFSLPATSIGGGTDGDQDRVTVSTYNGLGQVTNLTAYNGSHTAPQTTKYFYEDRHDSSLATNTIYPDSSESTPVSDTATPPFDQVRDIYHLNGQLKTRTDQRGVVITYTYDNARRLIREGATTLPSGVDGSIRSIVRSYDLMSRIEKITSKTLADGSGSVANEIKYTYGSHGKVTHVDQDHTDAVGTGSAHQTVEYTYDADVDGDNAYMDGLRTESVKYPKTNSKIWYGYGTADSISDRLGRVAEIRETNSGGLQLASYQYNGTSRHVLTDYQWPDVKLDLHQNTSGTYAGYDRFGRTVDHFWDGYNSTPNVDQFKYGYDAAGNRKWREDVVAGIQTTPVHHDEFYDYDNLHRLKNFDRGNLTGGPPPTGIAGTPGREQDWALDQLGNWSGFVAKTASMTDLDQTRYHNSANEIDGNGGNSITGTPNWADPTHDAAGNMITMPSRWDYVSVIQLKYDAWNRLVRAYDGEPIDEMEYDGLHRRIVRIEYSAPHDYYYNENWQLLETRRNGSSNPLEQFVWHPYYVDALAVRYWDGNTDGSMGGTNEGIHYYCQDANFNVTAVVNTSGTVLERYNYTPYGEVTLLNADFTVKSTQESAIGNLHLYTGRERDHYSGLQLNRHRFYASHLGRWLTRDPIGYGDGFNLFEYGRTMPMGVLDPTGTIGLVDPWPQPIYPPINPAPPPGTGSGFQLCRRNVGSDVLGASIINGCGGQHTYIQWGPCDRNGDPEMCTVGWGFSGGGAGRPPSPEKAFKPDWSRPLKRRKKGILTHGPGVGTPCSQATTGQIMRCIENRLTSKPYKWPTYVCSDWAQEAIDDCCLE